MFAVMNANTPVFVNNIFIKVAMLVVLAMTNNKKSTVVSRVRLFLTYRVMLTRNNKRKAS